MTFGAGGSTREGTLATVLEMMQDGLAAAPHLSCIGGTRESLRDVLTQYRAHGSATWLRCAAICLPARRTRVISATRATSSRSFATETGDGSTSTSPATRSITRRRASPHEDLDHFERKVRAGADSAITQYFYNRDAYWSFVDACAARGSRFPSCPASCRS